PILPVLPFKEVDEVIGSVNAGEKPLAMYVFSQDKSTVRRILSAVSSGGACINDVLVQITAEAPFGGVGNSGMGSYHGRDGYDAFTHRRTVVTSGTAFDPSVRYPPYSRFKNKMSKYLV
ncbi:MAG: aldehyde dehydrogenase family protein, partial [Actinomycetes bacterium]